MKRGIVAVILTILTEYAALMLMTWVFARCHSFERFTPTFIAGRDTVAYWNHGEFDLMYGGDCHVLYQFFPDGEAPQILNSRENSVCAYRERNRMLYVVLEQGYLAIDLDQSAVKAYDALDAMDAACQAAFSSGGFVWVKQ